jgi:hypothetical protein
MARGKGTLLVNLRGFVEHRDGKEAWAVLVSRLPKGDRDLLGGMVLSGGWYPVGVWNRLLSTYVADKIDPGRIMLDVARWVSDKDLNTVFKALLRMGTPGFVLGRTDSLWSRYFDVGKFTPKEVGDHHWHLILEAPPGEDEAPGEWTCNQGVVGWLEHALALTGAKTGRLTKTKCRFHGANRCEYEARW